MSIAVVVRLLVPREVDGQVVAVRPFDLTASDVDVLLELKPEGKVRNHYDVCDIISDLWNR